jgi:hypothetical protein
LSKSWKDLFIKYALLPSSFEIPPPV